MSTHTSKAKSKRQLTGEHTVSELLSYPVEPSLLLSFPDIPTHTVGVSSDGDLTGRHPTIIAQVALVHWNRYLETNGDIHRECFLEQASWLVKHASGTRDDSGGWPIASPHPDFPTRGPWLSALTQGIAISVLLRAYQLTREQPYF